MISFDTLKFFFLFGYIIKLLLYCLGLFIYLNLFTIIILFTLNHFIY